jgi:hypothetical protein
VWQEVRIADLAGPEWQNTKYYVNAWDGQKFVVTQAHSARVTTIKDRCVEMHLSNGKRVTSCTQHQFALAAQRFDARITGMLSCGLSMIPASSLKTGDRLVAQNPEFSYEQMVGKKASVLGIVKHKEHKCEPTEWYCLTVPTYSNFLLSCGLVSKNCHINALIMAVLYKFLPDLFKRGMVYVAKAHEFYQVVGKELFDAPSAAELATKLKAAGHRVEVHHIKGYGEINPTVLELMAFNPKTRRLVKVLAPDAKGSQMFEAIMGEGSEARKILLNI